MYLSACRPKVSRLKNCLDTFKKLKNRDTYHLDPNPHFDKFNCLFAPISQHVYWSGFVLGGSSCRSGKEAGSQYRYGGRICGGCGGSRIYAGGCDGDNRVGFISILSIDNDHGV